MQNHLANSTSPYLLQHAENPVDWYPWGDEALRRARAEDKPIFLSIGYAACHWCHVMAHESFTDAETARIMNQHFVSIKVDREERPDLDSIYMAATQALTGSGGWPMSVFLAPDLRPFYAGTYFPPVRRHNLPSFREILLSIAKAWSEQRDEVHRVGTQLMQHLRPSEFLSTQAGSLQVSDLGVAAQVLLDTYDWGYGGWGGPPKFPQPMLIDFLIRCATTPSPIAEQSLKAALHALKAMARGGMYDVLGGGFARYSTDNSWRVPHFEKMLYDNAQLARVYLHAWQISREPFFKQIAIATLDFVHREMTDAAGGFYSSLDADSEGEEGKYYSWTMQEIHSALAGESEFNLFAAAYSIEERGNWEGRTVLQRALDNATLAARFRLTGGQVAEQLAQSEAALLAVRSARTRPATDDKVLTGWNGLMLRAYAEAARVLDDRNKAEVYLEVATRSANFLTRELRSDGRLLRSWRSGRPGSHAFLEDYGALAIALLELYQTTFDERWYIVAQNLTTEMIERFADPSGGFFDTPVDSEKLLIRPKDLQDSATPSGSSLACEALLKLAALSDRHDYRDQAEKSLNQVSEAVRRFPAGFGHWLSAGQDALGATKQIALVYIAGAAVPRSFLDIINSEYRPNVVIAASPYPPSDVAPALLTDRPLKDGVPTAYVCEDFTCKLPVTSPEELQQQL